MKKLLVVDDSQTAKLLFRIYLPKDSGYEIHEASGLESALDVGKKIQPEVVFMDYNLPERNGVEIATDMLAAGIDTQFILLTGNTQASVVASASEAGFLTVLKKPITTDKIIEALKRLEA